MMNFMMSAVLVGLTSNVLYMMGWFSGSIFQRLNDDHVRVIYGSFTGLERCISLDTWPDVRSTLMHRMSERELAGVRVKVRSVKVTSAQSADMVRQLLQRYRSDVFVDGTYRMNCSDKPISLSLRYIGARDTTFFTGQHDSLSTDDVLLGKATAELEEYIKVIPRKDVGSVDF